MADNPDPIYFSVAIDIPGHGRLRARFYADPDAVRDVVHRPRLSPDRTLNVCPVCFFAALSLLAHDFKPYGGDLHCAQCGSAFNESPCTFTIGSVQQTQLRLS